MLANSTFADETLVSYVFFSINILLYYMKRIQREVLTVKQHS